MLAYSMAGADVDDAPFTGDLDLDAALTREQLAACLRIVHRRADRPSLRSLAIKTRHDATPLSKTTVSEMLSGNRFPRKALMIAFLQACGLSDAQIEPWRRAWERIATTGSAQPGSPTGHETAIRQPHSEAKPALDAGDEFPPVMPADLEPASHSAASHAGTGSMVSREARNPVTSRRELGAALRALRLGNGLTVEDAAERLLCSASKVSRMENGHGATLRDIRDLCGLYEVSDNEERNRLMELARQGRQQAWWQSFDLPFGDYIGLEEDATSIRDFHCGVIPGLLQTGHYAAALERAGKADAERIQAQVDMRLTRQQRILTRDDPPRYHTILDEAVLHRVCGSPGVMRGQLDRLIAANDSANITLQVLPFTAGAYPGQESSYTILEPAAPVPEVVYVEGLMGGLFLERTSDVSRYREAFREVQSQALTPADSITLIGQIARAMEG